jgi:acyl phosphate:glycerol-3-phosphate acyltransferase
MTYVWIGLLMLLSYFLGSIPSGLIIGKVFKNVDIRQFGSKNTGATNAIRVLGFRYGIFAFVFDMLKGALVILIVFLIGDTSLYLVGEQQINISSIYGMVAVLGHVFPIYINFKGGKAVATSAGMIFAIEPLVAFLVIIIFLVMFLKTRYVSLSSTTAAISALLLFMLRVFVPNIFIYSLNSRFNISTRIMDLVVVCILGTVIFIRHKANYKRLQLGTEYRFPIKQKK